MRNVEHTIKVIMANVIKPVPVLMPHSFLAQSLLIFSGSLYIVSVPIRTNQGDQK